MGNLQEVNAKYQQRVAAGPRKFRHSGDPGKGHQLFQHQQRPIQHPEHHEWKPTSVSGRPSRRKDPVMEHDAGHGVYAYHPASGGMHDNKVVYEPRAVNSRGKLRPDVTLGKASSLAEAKKLAGTHHNQYTEKSKLKKAAQQ